MIKQFTLIRPDNSIRNIWCPEDEIQSQIGQGEVVSAVFYSNELYKYDGTNFLLKTEYDKSLNKSLTERVGDLERELNFAGVDLPQQREKIKHLSKQACVDLINQAAGRARNRAVSQGTLIWEEYQLAITQVNKWREDGSPTQAPSTIECWATASGLTNELAAQSIEQAALDYIAILEDTRQSRLIGGAAVNAAAEDFAVVAQTYIDYLDAL